MQLEKREIVKCILLSIVTCGIYGIIWGINIARDAVKVKDQNEDALLEILLVLFLPFVGFYLCEKKLTEGCQALGIPHDDNSILYLILGIFGLGIVDYCLMQNDLNKLADATVSFGSQNYQAQEVPFENVDNNQQ